MVFTIPCIAYKVKGMESTSLEAEALQHMGGM